MNMNQLMNMILRLFVRKAVNKGINAGINKVTQGKGAPQRGQDTAPSSPPEQGQGGMTKEQVRAQRRARRAAREARQSDE